MLAIKLPYQYYFYVTDISSLINNTDGNLKEFTNYFCCRWFEYVYGLYRYTVIITLSNNKKIFIRTVHKCVYTIYCVMRNGPLVDMERTILALRAFISKFNNRSYQLKLFSRYF